MNIQIIPSSELLNLITYDFSICSYLQEIWPCSSKIKESFSQNLFSVKIFFRKISPLCQPWKLQIGSQPLFCLLSGLALCQLRIGSVAHEQLVAFRKERFIFPSLQRSGGRYVWTDWKLYSHQGSQIVLPFHSVSLTPWHLCSVIPHGQKIVAETPEVTFMS